MKPTICGRGATIALLTAAILLSGGSVDARSAPTGSSRWWKADLHVHSITSGDAVQDVGVMAAAARRLGFNAVFLTDHGAGDNAPIGGVVANHIRLADDVVQWQQATIGAPATSVDELVRRPVHSGAASLHLGAGSSGYGESFVWYKRGPDLHEGRDILRFSAYPTKLDAGSGVYVSVAVGGDPMLGSESGPGFADDPSSPGIGYPPQGYVTATGRVLPGHSVVFVWELGSPRASGDSGTSRTVVTKLPFALNRWNTYTIDVTKAVAALPPSIRPSTDEALAAIRVVAAANAGEADAYFDDLDLDATKPDPTGDEFVRRNRELPRYDAPAFRIFPSLEAGLKDHVQRFDYAITRARQWTLYKSGPDSIPGTHAAGYPAQLNHPGLPGGVTTNEAVATLAEGADLMEAVPRGTNEVMLNVWDRILARGRQVIGTWTSDAHRTEKLGPATYLYAPALTFDSLMRAAYEGRAYMALATFAGRVIFNLDASSGVPYAARYPVFVPRSQRLGFVHLRVTGGVPAGAHVVWIENGRVVDDDPAPAGSLDVQHSVPLGRRFAYVRAELRDASGTLVAQTEPIFFRPSRIPAGVTVEATSVATPNGRRYTRLDTLGVAPPRWSSRTMTVRLPNRPGSVVLLRIVTGAYAPTRFTGAAVLSHFFDRAHHVAVVAARAGAGRTTLHIRFAHAPAAAAKPPAGLQAEDVGATDVSLRWDAPRDPQTAVVVLRNDVPIAAVSPTTTEYVDRTARPSTSYGYAVAMVGFDGRLSRRSPTVAVTTERIVTYVLTPTADTYVRADHPTVSFGSLPRLRVAGSPTSVAYLKFDVSGITGRLRDASLRLRVNFGGAGYDVHAAATAWSETATFATAPPYAATVESSSGPLRPGTWSTVGVTLAAGQVGDVAFALTSSSPASGVNLASREAGPDAPQLVVHTQS